VQFVGDWETSTKYPVGTSEAQGAIIGDDLVIISGFIDGISKANNKNFALNLRNPNASWRPIDDLPISSGTYVLHRLSRRKVSDPFRFLYFLLFPIVQVSPMVPLSWSV
jgi:hypothetical protein